MTTYINLKSPYGRETVDEFNTRKEAKTMLQEYNMLSGGEYYLSIRACRGWNDE